MTNEDEVGAWARGRAGAGTGDAQTRRGRENGEIVEDEGWTANGRRMDGE